MAYMKPIKTALQDINLTMVINEGIKKAGSQNLLAKAAGVDQAMISNYLHGKKTKIAFRTAANLIDYVR